jgi:hypothetical protein
MMGPSEHDEQEGDEFDCTRLKAGNEEEVGDEFRRPTAFHWECGRADDYQHEDRERMYEGLTTDQTEEGELFGRPLQQPEKTCIPENGEAGGLEEAGHVENPEVRL